MSSDPPTVDRSSFSRFDPQSTETLFLTHDTDGLAELEAHLTQLAWGAEALRLGRALAAYEDQRGWRTRAESRFGTLLRLGERDAATFATLHYDLAELTHRWGDYDGMEQHLAAARRALAVLDDWVLEARDLRLAALLSCERNQIGSARRDAERSLVLAAEHADWPAQAAALHVLSYSLGHAGQFADAADCTHRILAGDQAVLPLKLRAGAISDHGYALRRVRGDEAALPFYTQALEIQAQRRDPLELRIACANLGDLYRKLERLDEAEVAIQRGIAALEQADMLDYGDILFNSLGNIQSSRGDPAAAAELYQRALTCGRQRGNRQQQAITCVNLAIAYRDLKKPQESAAWRFCAGALAFELGREEDAERRFERVRQFIEPGYLNLKRATYHMIARYAGEVDLAPQTVRALALRVGLDPDDAERHPKVLTSLGLYYPLLDDQSSWLVDTLSRSAAMRRAARALGVGRGDRWLRELTHVLDGEVLLVVHPGLGRGYRVRISGIANNFQLQPLLADAIMSEPVEDWRPGRRPDPRVVAAARDQRVDPAADTVHIAFGMANWLALQPDGTLDNDFDTSAHLITNEDIPANIPYFEGIRVLLIGPASYPRAWNAGRRFPAMHGDLRVVETLSPTAVRDWLSRIARAAR